MVTYEGTRPGGRSARIQQSVHDATRGLLTEIGREELTVPMIAARAEGSAVMLVTRVVSVYAGTTVFTRMLCVRQAQRRDGLRDLPAFSG